MEDWKVGDKVAIRQYSSIESVDTVKEITKGGNIRLTNSPYLYNANGSLRGGGSWGSTYIRKITDKEYDDYLIKQQIKVKRKKIIDKLNSLNDNDLLSYWQKIDMAYHNLIGE